MSFKDELKVGHYKDLDYIRNNIRRMFDFIDNKKRLKELVDFNLKYLSSLLAEYDEFIYQERMKRKHLGEEREI